MKLALGTVQFGTNYGIQGRMRPSEEMINEIISLAMKKKIYHFDTAYSYGDAEEILGRYREKNPNITEKMHIISKLAPKALDDNIPQRLWKDIVLRNTYESIRKLKVNKLEALLFHNAEYIFNEKAVHALHCVCRENIAKKIGVSIYHPDEAMKALEYEEIKIIQIPYNVFDQRLDKCGFFDKAKRKSVNVYARSSLLQGLLIMDPNCLPKQMGFAKEYLKRFLSICGEYQIAPLKAATGFVSHHSDIDYIVFGVDNKVQLSQYISMQDEKLPEDMIRRFQKEFIDVEEKLVNPVLWNR